jgi:deoxyribonuclease-4
MLILLSYNSIRKCSIVKLNIGPHISISNGYENAGKIAKDLDANTFQFFTRNPRGGRAKKLVNSDVEKLKKFIMDNNFAPLVAHAPYTLNMCSANPQIREFARMVFKDDITRMEKLPCNLYNFHPGSHTGQGIEKGIEQIVEILNEVMTEDMTTIILLETMSGKGSEIGKTFKELKEIIRRVNYNDKIGICFDTCHTYSAGYDIVNNLEGVLEEFDNILGLERLKAIHVNDSMYGFKVYKDRHAKIGEGILGLDTIVNLITHPQLKHLPFILETPNDESGYKEEIRLLRSMAEK